MSFVGVHLGILNFLKQYFRTQAWRLLPVVTLEPTTFFLHTWDHYTCNTLQQLGEISTRPLSHTRTSALFEFSVGLFRRKDFKARLWAEPPHPKTIVNAELRLMMPLISDQPLKLADFCLDDCNGQSRFWSNVLRWSRNPLMLQWFCFFLKFGRLISWCWAKVPIKILLFWLFPNPKS